MNFKLVLLVFSFVLMNCSAQNTLFKLKLKKGEEFYGFIQTDSKEYLTAITKDTVYRQYFIQTKGKKQGPYDEVRYHREFGRILKKHDRFSLLYNHDEFGTFDSIAENGAIAISEDKKQIVFEVHENKKNYLFYSLTGRRYGPFNLDYIHIVGFSQDQKRILYEVQNSEMIYLYENDSLIRKSRYLRGGYAPDNSIYSVEDTQSHAKLYFHQQLRPYINSNYLNRGRVFNGVYLFYWNASHNLEYECFTRIGSAGKLYLCHTDSGVYTIDKLVRSGPYQYVDMTFKSSIYEDYSFVYLQQQKYILNINGKTFGPFDEVPKLELNNTKNEKAEKWAYSIKMDGLFYIITDKRKIGPYKQIGKIAFYGNNDDLIYRAEEVSDSVFIFFKRRKTHCLSIRGDFDVSFKNDDILFIAFKGDKTFRGINDSLVEVSSNMSDYVSSYHYSWTAKAFIDIAKKGNVRYIYINNMLVDSFGKIKNWGVNINGNFFYEGINGLYHYRVVGGNRFGPFKSITPHGHGYTFGWYSDFNKATKLLGTEYLFYKDSIYGPFNHIEDFTQNYYMFSNDSSKFIFKARKSGMPCVFVNHQQFGPHLVIGDYVLTKDGPCYYAMNDSNTIFLRYKNFKIEWPRNISQFYGYYDDYGLSYNWEKDVLSYHCHNNNGQYVGKLIYKDKIYIGEFSRYTDESEIIYLVGKKVKYRKL